MQELEQRPLLLFILRKGRDLVEDLVEDGTIGGDQRKALYWGKYLLMMSWALCNSI